MNVPTRPSGEENAGKKIGRGIPFFLPTFSGQQL
jgi:hypothetical protein